ncbi:OX-2 membrane glycoprotein-like isoform X1 [Larimichthys crocea]|uniref:OX-2 membrane glycoprotein-like isoform X1 n=1 Tax=Larimichthys crocea TaxID=215358 RepID=UPI000F5E643F|nr:OX-2 membrane glycoprotein-like isoform X1 [Larimichthys crocea]
METMLQIFVLAALILKGQAALIQTQLTVMAAVGDEACLSCQLTPHKEVLQVTWQKLSPEAEKDVATSTKHFGLQVNPGFRDKVEFKDAGLQNSSIVIRNVTEQDESCYQCSFYTNPEGALTGRTCLKVYELHEPVLHVESNSAEEAVVSCSATGRPAPTVTLRVLRQDLHLSDYSSVSVTNTNSTVTVTSTAVLSGFRDDSTQVGCAVRVLSGPQKEVLMMIPEVKQSSADGFDELSGSNNHDHRGIWISVSLLVVLVVCGILTLFFLRRKRRNQNSLSHRNVKMNEMVQVTVKDTEETESSSLPHRDNEMNEEDEATVKDTEETEASSDTQNKVQIRRRTSPEKDQSGDNSNPTPSLSKTR